MKIKKLLCMAIAGLVSATHAGAQQVEAGSDLQRLNQCVTLRTTGADRVTTARWLFVVMTSAPQINDLALTTDVQKEAADRGLAQLIVRLATQDCAPEFAKLAKTDLKFAFESLGEQMGRVAMDELMNGKEVEAAVGRYTRHLREDDFKELLANIDQSPVK